MASWSCQAQTKCGCAAPASCRRKGAPRRSAACAQCPAARSSPPPCAACGATPRACNGFLRWVGPQYGSWAACWRQLGEWCDCSSPRPAGVTAGRRFCTLAKPQAGRLLKVLHAVLTCTVPLLCPPTCPQLSVADALAQEPIAGVRSIPKERWDLLCTVCRQRVGAKIQCDACFAAYHPLCARVAGANLQCMQLFRALAAPGSWLTSVQCCRVQCAGSKQATDGAQLLA
jgi:hypothetical protein